MKLVKIEPTFSFGNFKMHRINVNDFKAQKYITVTDNYELMQATVYFAGEGFKNAIPVNILNNNYNKFYELLDKCVAGSSLVFTNVKVKNSFEERTLPEVSYTLY